MELPDDLSQLLAAVKKVETAFTSMRRDEVLAATLAVSSRVAQHGRAAEPGEQRVSGRLSSPQLGQRWGCARLSRA